MSTGGDQLTQEQKRHREEILTQEAPSKSGTTAGATILKHGDVYLLSNDGGDVPWELPHVYGLYAHDCRFLNGLELRLEDHVPSGLSTSHIGEQHSAHELTNAQKLQLSNGASLEESTVAIRRSREMHHGVLHERICLTNHGRDAGPVRLSIRVRCQFEDVFVVKGFTDAERGVLSGPQVKDDRTIEWTYQGRDGRIRRTYVAFDPAPHEIRGDEAHFIMHVAPEQSAHVALAVTPVAGDEARRVGRPSPIADTSSRHRRRAEALWVRGATRVRSSDELFDRVLHRALLDLRILRSRLGRFHYLAGGVPWFVTLFGRDTAISTIQTLAYGPAIARDTLLLLARYQAETHDAFRDAERGKILHELRRGELAHLGEIPQSPAYYGTVDATMLFLILASEYLAWSGDLDTIARLRPHIDLALEWMATCGDHDGDGYFDYLGQYQNGLVNQGWKDSGKAIVNADGSLAEPPIALAEVQSYAYLAWRESARILRALGDEIRANDLEQRADTIRSRFARDFWSDDLGCYILARQRGGRPAIVVASNAGQVLWGGIATAEHAGKVVERLMLEDMFSGWGIRTLSTQERRYNPISYHCGSVWPHDNSLILAGARHYGADEFAVRLFDALFAAAVHLPGFRLPELYCGHPRHRGEPPVQYPHASAPQAWAAGALPYAVWSLLGLRPNAIAHRLDLVRPVLPARVQWVEVDGLRVGSARARIRFERRADGSVSTDADVDGELDVHVVHAVDGHLPRPITVSSSRS